MSRAAGTGLLFVGLLAAAGCNGTSYSGPPLVPTIVHLPSPTIALVPPSARAGSPGLTITITGKDFKNGERYETSVATWVANGSEHYLSTHFVDSSHLTADIPADLLRQPVSATISVNNTCGPCDSETNRGSATFVVAQ